MGWAPGAKLAALVGGFNNGNPNAKVLTRDEIGVWKTLLPNEKSSSAPTSHDSVDEAKVCSHLQPELPKSLRSPATKVFTKPSNVDINEGLCNGQRCWYPQKPLLKSGSGSGRAREGLEGALPTEDSSKSAGLTVDLAGAPTAPLTSLAKLYQSMVEEEKLPKIRVDSIKDEVWNLLHESLVSYCGNPVGTIAVNDLSSINILNYDRSWEKTMDCHNPGQGLMLVSFKVRVVLLDGDDSVTKEILDINLISRSGTPADFKSLANMAHSLSLWVLRDVIHSQSNNNITYGLNGFDVGHPSLIRWCSWMPASSSLNIMFGGLQCFFEKVGIL
ncbi:hypothetical protein Nepgr_005397 [Nepenthes gracilis]|uniref:Uncharacterized protein n=1 Tax=Nepenthes gracilis TaxID=150966 RepID=A0AAD3S330_NEPGR|nr:hypothetical protein Nepgr_005397 [Nepenthes gracilis]